MGYSKYGGVKTRVDGILFASKLEAKYYNHLKRLQADGVVKSIGLQVPFVLLEPFTDKNGEHVRGIKYIADFDVVYSDGRREIVDTKGAMTDVFKIKAKLFKFKYPDLEFKVIKYVPRLGGFITWQEHQDFKNQQEKNKGRKVKQKHQKKKKR